MKTKSKTYQAKDPVVAPKSWDALLREAVEKPGIISAAYSHFHDYSFGNQMLAFVQCLDRGLELGPIGTFKKWTEKGRTVKKGEKAIILCQPRSWAKEVEDKETGEKEKVGGVFFTFRRGWFLLSQTSGPDVEIPVLPEWDGELALENLGIERVPFELMNGNVQGYAKQGKKLALNPVAVNPAKTTIHEIAHILLGHTKDGDVNDTKDMTRNIREVEAECVALLVCDSLGLPGADESRGYVQSWYKSSEQIPEKNSQRIFSAASAILKAGKKGSEKEQTEEE